MLFHCRFTWHAYTNYKKVAERIIQQDELGTNHPERIKDWFTLAGGGAGYLLIEADTANQVSEILYPYMDLMSWDVHAVTRNTYATVKADAKKSLT